MTFAIILKVVMTAYESQGICLKGASYYHYHFISDSDYTIHALHKMAPMNVPRVTPLSYCTSPSDATASWTAPKAQEGQRCHCSTGSCALRSSVDKPCRLVTYALSAAQTSRRNQAAVVERDISTSCKLFVDTRNSIAHVL